MLAEILIEIELFVTSLLSSTLLEQFIVTGAFKMCLLVSAIILARLTVFWMDKHIDRGKSSYSKWLNQASDTARGIVYGARWIGVAIIAMGAIS